MSLYKDQVHVVLQELQGDRPMKAVTVWTPMMTITGVPFFVNHMPYVLGIRSDTEIHFIGLDHIITLSTRREDSA